MYACTYWFLYMINHQQICVNCVIYRKFCSLRPPGGRGMRVSIAAPLFRSVPILRVRRY